MAENNKVEVENQEDLSETIEEAEDLSEEEAEDSVDPDTSMEKEIEDLTNTLARLQADFINYRNRVEKEKSDVHKYATFSLMEKLLSVLDNFDRAIDASTADSETLEGFELIRKELFNIMSSQGLEEIDSTGFFDPNLHNAVLAEPSEKESGEIIETLQKGYKLGDRILRASMVKVSQ